MNVETQIKLNKFKPRDYQIPIMDAVLNKNYKRVFVIMPRRSGKDVVAFNVMIRASLQTPGIYYMIYPTYSQGRKILWDSVMNDGKRFLDFVPPELIESSNSTEMKIRLKNGSLIQVLGSDNFDCYDDQTELLTEHGWKLFKDLDKKERVATLIDGNMVYETPSSYMHYDYDGTMFSISSSSMDFMVTPNHRFWVKTVNGSHRFKVISDPSICGALVPAQSGWHGNIQEKFFGYDTHHFVALLGIFLSLGTTCAGTTGNTIFICESKERVRRRISGLLDAMDLRFSSSKEGFIINNHALFSYFDDLGLRDQKYIPHDIKSLDKKYLKILFEWLLLGDGYDYETFTAYYSSSKKLIDDVQEVIIKLGFSGNIRTLKGVPREYEIRVRKSKYKRFQGAHKSYLQQSHYTGKVYCVSVSSGVIKVRRNGKEMWCGNSLVGTNPRGVVLSEYALQDPRCYQYLRPALTAIDGWALFITTPRGKNSAYELFQIAQQNPDDWFAYHLTIEDTQHIPLELIEKERLSGEMSEDLIQQEYFCFPAGQEVLTGNGSIPIELVAPNDMVVSHSGRLRRVMDTLSRDYVGELIEINSFGSSEPIVCTPNHPIRVYDRASQSYSWKAAENITEEDRLVFPKMHFGAYKIIRRELCMLLAWYISDGSCFKNGVQFTVRPEKAETIIHYLAVLDIPCKRIPDSENHVVNIVVNSSQLVDFFRSSCGLRANNKKIPFNLISGYEEDFLHELMRGDGCHNASKGHERFVYTTVSKTLAYQIQLLANSLNLGYAVGISTRDAHTGIIQGRTVNCQISYQLNISFMGIRTHNSWLIRAKNCIAAKIKSIKRYEYVGAVYNLKVQYDESYLVSGRAVHNCSFEMGVEGSYYSKYIDKMRINGRIGHVPWESSARVYSVWDIGVRDSTCIIWYQVIGQSVRIIDCYEKNKEGLEHYVSILNSKPYIYNKHFAPHDVAVTEWGSGLSRLEKARQLGLKFETKMVHNRMVSALPDLSIIDGIEAVRSMFSRVWIDEVKCAPLIKALENYRQTYDAKRKVYSNQPLHNWSSHFSDAMRYLALSLPRTKDSLSAQELDQRYYESMGADNHMPNFFKDDSRRMF